MIYDNLFCKIFIEELEVCLEIKQKKETGWDILDKFLE